LVTPLAHMPAPDPTLDAAAILGQSGAENFPVASVLLPRRVRSHLLALYGFARLADDIGDEAPGDRLAQLDWLETELDRAFAGTATHPIFVRLMPTVRACDLPIEPFRALIAANRVDQSVARYETFEDLLGYCQLSAVPVGRLVLAVFGAQSPAQVALSDDVCAGLQVVEHLQDVAEDAGRGRIYLPGRELRASGVGEDELRAASASPALRRVVAVQAARATRLLASGPLLARSLPLQPRIAVAGFTGGGLAALDAIRRSRYDVLATAARPSAGRVVLRSVQALAGRAP
jgi:squalene synthase HpnC